MTARKPDHLKLLAGTSRRDRVAPATPGLPALDAMPSPPAWLTNLDAVREWNRLAPVLTVNRLLTPGNVALFAQLCALHGRLVELWAAGTTPTAALVSAYRALSSELGLLSLRLSVPATKPNRFAELARRRR